MENRKARIADMYRRFGTKGFLGVCLLKVLSVLGIRLMVSYWYVKDLDGAGTGGGCRSGGGSGAGKSGDCGCDGNGGPAEDGRVADAGSACNDCVELTAGDFERQAKVQPERFTPERVERLRKLLAVEGNHAIGIYEGGVLASYGCFSTRYWAGSDRELKETDAYLWEDYTHPAYRGRGLHRKIVKCRDAELVKYGKKRAAGLVHFYNRASEVAVVEAGYKRRTRVCEYSIWGGKPRRVVSKCRTGN